MDTVTHALIGAVAARACSRSNNEKSPRLALVFVAGLAATFPDIDYLMFWVNPYRFITDWHRGLTHSLILLPVWAALLSTAAFFIMKKLIPFIVIFKYSVLGLSTHIIFDLITLYGVQLFAPFSDRRYALSLTFDIDPWIGLLALLGLAIGAEKRTNAVYGLCAIGAYIGLMFTLQQHALSIIDAHSKTGSIPDEKMHALPQPGIPFHWKLIIDREGYYETANLSLFAAATSLLDGLITRQNLRISAFSEGLAYKYDDAYLIKFSRHIPETVLADFRSKGRLRWKKLSKYGDSPQEIDQALEAWRHDSFSRFRYFASLPILYRIDKESGATCIWYTDLRYVMPFMAPPFRYGMCRQQASKPWRLHRLRRNTENERQRLE